MPKFVCHFSCGVTSAIASLLTIMLHGRENVEVVYADPGAEHEDNQRFLRDFEELAGVNVTVLKSDKYTHIRQVFEERRFLVSPAGAPCTVAMKKIPIQQHLGARVYDDIQVLGYTGEERQRIERFRQNNPLVSLLCELELKSLDKRDCMAICKTLGLRLPQMYIKGYSNANCKGCVKCSSLGYWAAIRHDFPEDFDWYARFEREIGAKMNDGTRKGAAICKKYIKGERKRVFLDEIPEDYPHKRNISISCGYSCGMQDESEIEDQLTGEPSFFALEWESILVDTFLK